MEKKTTEEIGEVLEAVWTLQEQGIATVDEVVRSAKTAVSEKLLAQLQEEGMVAVEDSGRINLLPNGRQIAENIIRRHRLAERLICDALGSHVEDSEAAACEYEHVLAEGITNSICTLLGHPRYCPHNKPIPEGSCCRQTRSALKSIVASCDQLDIGESARVAYFSFNDLFAINAPRLFIPSVFAIRGCPVRHPVRTRSRFLRTEPRRQAISESI